MCWVNKEATAVNEGQRKFIEKTWETESDKDEDMFCIEMCVAISLLQLPML